MYDKLSDDEKAAFIATAGNLQVDPDYLYMLIDAESGWDPLAQNPASSAKGLIQWIDSSSQALGFQNSYDLITKCPDIVSQLPLVQTYLSQYAPYATEQSLYMAVFYPAARTWPSSQQFPDSVIKANNGIIKTPLDYINFVHASALKAYLPFLVIGGIALVFIITQTKGA